MPDYDAPINTLWGYDNRTVGLRVPNSDAQARRVENRLAGADANPYLAIAASLACGYLGMKEKLKPRAPIEGSAYRLARTLPRTLYDALERFNGTRALKPIFGAIFVEAVTVVKGAELDAYQLVTQASRSPIANVCDANYTIVAKMPKRYLPPGTSWMGDAHRRLRAVGDAVRAERE